MAFKYCSLLYISRMTSSCVTYTDPASNTLFDLLRCLQIWVTRELSIFRICMLALWYNDWCQPELCQVSLITTSYIPFQTIRLALSFWSTPPFTYLSMDSTIWQSFSFLKVPLLQWTKITCYCCHCLVGEVVKGRWEVVVTSLDVFKPPSLSKTILFSWPDFLKFLVIQTPWDFNVFWRKTTSKCWLLCWAYGF